MSLTEVRLKTCLMGAAEIRESSSVATKSGKSPEEGKVDPHRPDGEKRNEKRGNLGEINFWGEFLLLKKSRLTNGLRKV